MVACGLPYVPKGKPEASPGNGQGVGLFIDCTAPPVARQGESVRAAVNVRLTAEDFAGLARGLPGRAAEDRYPSPAMALLDRWAVSFFAI